jgi:hypothetical protein
MRVSLAVVTARSGWFVAGLLLLPFGKNLLQALSIERKARSCRFSHLLRKLEPVHSHTYRILPAITVIKLLLPAFTRRSAQGGCPA